MRSLFDYLREHTLVWLIPVAILFVLLVFLAWKAATAPGTPFIYDM